MPLSLLVASSLFLGCAQEPDTKTEVEQIKVTQELPPQLNQIRQTNQQREVGYLGQAAEQSVADIAYSVASPAPIRKKVLAPPHQIETNYEKYPQFDVGGVQLATEQPVSTFAIDVDTASYANMRRMLNQGRLPLPEMIRTEELINYFSYHYSQPEAEPFSVYTELAPSPFNQGKHLLHIGIQGKKIAAEIRPDANLVFLVDVSGSMNNPNKLGLLKRSLKLLTKQLTNKDKVTIVTYAGSAGVKLTPTSGDDYFAISQAIDNLTTGGATHGSAGITTAYQLAESVFSKDGINRVILATDGDFNVGVTSQNALKQLIEQKRKTGIELSILGFGQGNYNDALMQELAQNGNGNAYYIDGFNEARKVLLTELTATLVTIAKDVKIQLEFNPEQVYEYRLLGYETRQLKREDFNNDKVDAGEIGAGHTVTAIYELTLAESSNKLNSPLRYGNELSNVAKTGNKNQELAFLKLRYKQAKGTTSQLIEQPILLSDIQNDFAKSSELFRFSAAVAGFADLLKGGQYQTGVTIDKLANMALNSKGKDKFGYKSEFIQLLGLADVLSTENTAKINVKLKTAVH